MGYHEVTVDHLEPVPKGYGFLRKGNVYQTGLCRRLTREADKTLFVVTREKRTLGLRAPIFILKEVHEKDEATKGTRQANVARRDLSTRNDFKAVLLRQFPSIPPHSVELVLDHTLKKSSGRVGRTGTCSVEDKVRLAVVAHVRHRWTEYETLLRGGMPREKARREVKGEIGKVLRSWGGTSPQVKKMVRQPATKTATTKLPMTKVDERRILRSGNRLKTMKKTPEIKTDAQPVSPAMARPERNQRKRERRKERRRASSTASIRKSPRFQPATSGGLEVLDNFFNDEDDPIVISSDDSDVEMEDVTNEGEVYEIKDTPPRRERVDDDFVIYDSTDDSDDDFIL